MLFGIGIIVIVALVLGLLFLYFIYVTTPTEANRRRNRPGERIDPETVSIKWQEVQAMMKMGGPANYKQSIMEADKIVDMVLRSKVPGETMGERLKNAKHLFSQTTYNDLWTAHKIRNQLAHEANFEGHSSEATLAVRNFEKALKELRAI